MCARLLVCVCAASPLGIHVEEGAGNKRQDTHLHHRAVSQRQCAFPFQLYAPAQPHVDVHIIRAACIRWFDCQLEAPGVAVEEVAVAEQWAWCRGKGQTAAFPAANMPACLLTACFMCVWV